MLVEGNDGKAVRVRVKGEGLHTLAGVASCEGWGTLTLVFTPKIILLFFDYFCFFDFFSILFLLCFD